VDGKLLFPKVVLALLFFFSFFHMKKNKIKIVYIITYLFIVFFMQNVWFSLVLILKAYKITAIILFNAILPPPKFTN
jgi:hypothetical protein